jgi:hypothetical protein
MSSKLVEAAAAEAFKWIGLAANVHWTDPHVDEGRKNIWRSAMRKAILAFLEAALEDEGVVEDVARGIYAGWQTKKTVTKTPFERAPINTQGAFRVDAANALRALIQQVKS